MCKNNSSVSSNFLPGYLNRHLQQLIYETNILIAFNNFKKFLTIFNGTVGFNFIFSHSLNFKVTCDDNLVIHYMKSVRVRS